MPHDLSSHLDLSGHLLLAAPSLRDPNFARSAIFLSAHEADDGAFGYIINRPLKQQVSELMPDKNLGALATIKVHFGGPVATHKLAFAAMSWDEKQHTVLLHSHLSIEDAHHHHSMGHRLIAFVGYSGWTTGQLENEIAHRSWITTTAGAFLLQSPLSPDVWSRALHHMGPAFQLLAGIPTDPRQN